MKHMCTTKYAQLKMYMLGDCQKKTIMLTTNVHVNKNILLKDRKNYEII